MPITVEESLKYREFVSRIAQENGCFDFQPDQIVWHYTDGPGLLGIIQSSQLFATQVSALNDAKETKYASELFLNAIRQLKETRNSEPDVVALLDLLIQNATSNEQAPFISKFFVACFSGEADDLAQWDRYGKQNGYAIGFFARGLAREETSKLYRVIYDNQKQEEAAKQLAEATVSFYLEGLKGERLNNPSQWATDFLIAWDEWIYKLAPLAKHSRWRAENEFRLVHELKLSEFSLVRFAAKKTMIGRYIPLTTPSWVPRRTPLLPIAKILVGPGNNFAATSVSLKLLLDQMAYPPVSIENTICSLTNP